MENIGKDIFDPKEPEKTGDIEDTKKKKKKISSRIPLPIEKHDSGKDKKGGENEAQPTLDIFSLSGEKLLSEDEFEVAKDDKEGDTRKGELSEPEQYMGELIIDHSDELSSPISVGEQIENDIFEHEDTVDVSTGAVSSDNHSALEEADLISNPSTLDIEEFTPWDHAANQSQESVSPTLNDVEPGEVNTKDISFDQSVGIDMINPNVVVAEELSNESNKFSPGANNREYYAEKRGLSRGLSTGLLFGWLIGRRGKERPSKSITDVETGSETAEDMVVARAALKKRIGILERTQQELQVALDRSREGGERLGEKIAEVSSRILGKKEAPLEVTKQTLYEVAKPEMVKARIEAPKTIEDYIGEAENSSDQTPDRRVETSAWHRIEIDNKTGKLAESPSFEYGEAFVREQQQEKLAREAINAQAAGKVGSTIFSGGDATDASLKSIGANKSKPIISSDDIFYAVNKVVSNTTNPSIWAVALLLVIFMVVFGII